MSPEIHALIKPGVDYDLLEIAPDDLATRLPKLLTEYDGLNVTIPYKEKVQDYLSIISEEAAQVGAVNTIYGGQGFNTDLYGFKRLDFDYKGKTVLILGSGGVAKTMLYSVGSLGAAHVIMRVRDKQKTQPLVSRFVAYFPHCEISLINDDELSKWNDPIHYILNGTPLGMWPKVNCLPLDENSYLKLLESGHIEAVFDSIYNPLSTRFLLLARQKQIEAVNGLQMLFYQALEAQIIWGNVLENDVYDAKPDDLTQLLLSKFPIKLVLSGFMASGKTTIAREIAKRIKLKFIDLDFEIEQAENSSIAQIFKTSGEAYFRQKEAEVLARFMHGEESFVLATGGGTLLQAKNLECVRQNSGQIIYLDVSLNEAIRRAGDRSSRPLLQAPDEVIKELYEARQEKYHAIADCVINADLTPARVVDSILNLFLLG